MPTILKNLISFISRKEVYGVIVTCAIAYFAYKTIGLLLEVSITKGKDLYEKKKRKTIVRLLNNVIKYLTLIITFIIILSLYGVNVKAMVAGLGITATILGLALQDTFKDIINGMNIILENYFIVGDIVGYNDFTGEVIEFGLKSTKIKNANGEVMIIANRNIMEVKNISQKENAVTLTIPLPYEQSVDKMEKIINDEILPKIKEIKNVIVDSVVYLGISELADSSVNYMIKFRCKRETHWQAQRDAYGIILRVLDKKKISIPYPQLEVHNAKKI